MTPVQYWRITHLDDLRDLNILYETFDVQGGRTRVAFAQNPTPNGVAAFAQPSRCHGRQQRHFCGLVFGQDQLSEVTDSQWWRCQPPHVREKLLVQGDEPFGRPDPIEISRVSLTPQLRIQPLFLELHRRFRVDEVAGRDLTAMPCHEVKRRERLLRAPLRYVQLVEQARGVDEVEGAWVERHSEDVACEKMDRGGKPSLAKRSLRIIDALRIHVDSGDATAGSYPLAKALDPERRRSSCVEHVETADVPEEVEFTVAEGDEIVFELLSLFQRQGVLFV